MSAISITLRSTLVAMLSLSSLYSSSLAALFAPEDTPTKGGTSVHQTMTATTNVSVNPFVAKLSEQNVAQLKAIIDKVYAKGAGLTDDKFVAYLTKMSDGLRALAKKPAYAANEAIQNIVGYMDYEFAMKIQSFKKSDADFMSEFGNVLNENPPAPTSTSSTAPINSSTGASVPAGDVVPNSAGNVTGGLDAFTQVDATKFVVCRRTSTRSANAYEKVVLFPLPKAISTSDAAQAIAYQRYLSCSKISSADFVAAASKGALYGFTVDADGLLVKSSDIKTWESLNTSFVDYAFDTSGKLLKISGVQYSFGSTNTGSTVPGKMVSCILSDKMGIKETVNLPLMQLPSGLASSDIAKVDAYQKYLSCTKKTVEDVKSSMMYNYVPAGFQSNVRRILKKNTEIQNWEYANKTTVKYAFDHTWKVYMIDGVIYNEDNTEVSWKDSYGCRAGTWWSQESRSCLANFLEFKRMDGGPTQQGTKTSDFILVWRAAGMANCTATGAWEGSKDLAGRLVVADPASILTYTITCKTAANEGNELVLTKSVTVDPRPKITSLKMENPDYGKPLTKTVKIGESVNISWTTTSATSCRLFNNSTTSFSNGAVPANGSISIKPTGASTYIFNCSGPGGDTEYMYLGLIAKP